MRLNYLIGLRNEKMDLILVQGLLIAFSDGAYPNISKAYQVSVVL